MEKLFRLEIITPQRVVFDGLVHQVQAPGVGGRFGILYNHTAFLTTLQVGHIEIDTEAGKKWFATSGGFAEVMNNKMSILVETAEEASEINTERAQQARDRAWKRLHEEKTKDIDIPRAQAALARAMNRLLVAEHKSGS
jgi:F-type H+-transporting ATPase subunit epsilon